MSRLVRITLSSAVVIFARLASAAEPAPQIHACVDTAGNVVYQDDECAVIAPKPAEPKPAAPKTKSPKSATPPKAASRAQAAPPKIRVKPAAPVVAARRAPSTPTKGIKAVIDPATFTSDPRWGSPERTLKTFIAAMKDGDRSLARACLTATALTDFGPRVDSLPAESLRATVTAFTGFVLEGDLGPVWSIRAIRGKDRPKWIFFERAGDGTWKISAI